MNSPSWQSALTRLVGAYSPATLRAYRSDYVDFARWCETKGLEAFPASASIASSYLEQQPQHLKPTTLRRRVVAISRLHILSGMADPTDDIDVALVLRRRYRRHAAYPQQAFGLTRDKLQALLQTCDESLRGLRDKAMLLVGFEALCRRSEIVRLSVEDIGTNLRDKPVVMVHESKNGPFIRERLASLSSAGMESLASWLAASKIHTGAVFRPIYHQTVVDRRICGMTIVRVIKERARQAGLLEEVIETLSGHSLRVGAAQQLALNGYDTAQIMRAGGWKSITTLSRYIEGAAVSLWAD